MFTAGDRAVVVFWGFPSDRRCGQVVTIVNNSQRYPIIKFSDGFTTGINAYMLRPLYLKEHIREANLRCSK